MYFWENNYDRALEWAQKNPKIKNPSVLGAVIDLGRCLDFLDTRYLKLLLPTYEILKDLMNCADAEMPENKNIGSDSHGYLRRNLDCSVIQLIHQREKKNGKTPYDSVRGVFWEGDAPYLNLGFREKNHNQISVRKPNSIKGYFIPRNRDDDWCIP